MMSTDPFATFRRSMASRRHADENVEVKSNSSSTGVATVAADVADVPAKASSIAPWQQKSAGAVPHTAPSSTSGASVAPEAVCGLPAYQVPQQQQVQMPQVQQQQQIYVQQLPNGQYIQYAAAPTMTLQHQQYYAALAQQQAQQQAQALAAQQQAQYAPQVQQQYVVVTAANGQQYLAPAPQQQQVIYYVQQQGQQQPQGQVVYAAANGQMQR
jgi:hypothetical protein